MNLSSEAVLFLKKNIIFVKKKAELSKNFSINFLTVGSIKIGLKCLDQKNFSVHGEE